MKLDKWHSAFHYGHNTWQVMCHDEKRHVKDVPKIKKCPWCGAKLDWDQQWNAK